MNRGSIGTGRQRKSRLPLMLTVFFAVVLAVNFFVLWLGGRFKPPLVRDDYYPAEVRYAEAISATAQTAASGITEIVKGQNPPRFFVFDHGEPVSAVTGTEEWYRPNDPKQDFAVAITAPHTAVLPGRWDVTRQVYLPDGRAARFTHRLYLEHADR